MPERIPLLLNPKAGSFFRSGLKDWLRKNGEHFCCIETTSAVDLSEHARRLADTGAPLVAAAGGDGTLMCAAQGLLGSETALGILPCGTMNVLARELGIGSRRFDIALQAIQGDYSRKIDIFAINGKPFLQLASFGLDARVVELITPRMKKNLGAAAHILTAAQTSMEPLPRITLTLTDGEGIKGSEILLGNGKRYAGAGTLFADADYRDGLLDVAVIQQSSIGVLYEILSFMFMRGARQDNLSTGTELRQIKTGRITCSSTTPYQLDGDFAGVIEPGEEAIITQLPDKLKVAMLQNPPPENIIEAMAPRIEKLIKKMESLGY